MIVGSCQTEFPLSSDFFFGTEKSLSEKKDREEKDTLPETNIAHENPYLSLEIPLKWWIFMGYVSLPEGNRNKQMIGAH